MFFKPFGVYPNNGIVGGQAPIAAGAALYKKIRGEKGAVVANIGDGALGAGAVSEAINFAAMDQYRALWADKGGLPIIFAISDNGYGMGGQTRGETMGYGEAARIGAGISPDNLGAERLDGNNVLAVIDAYRRKKAAIGEGRAPVLLDVVTYRLEGHSQSDRSSYREKEEIAAWRKRDPIELFKKELLDNEVFEKSELEAVESEAEERIFKAVWLAADDKISPYFPEGKMSAFIEGITFANEKSAPDEKTAVDFSGLGRLEEIAENKKSGAYTVSDAIFEAVAGGFKRYEKLVSYGEDVREWGGASGVYRGLAEALPYRKLFNSPISEAAIVGTAVGYAMSGGRAIVEIMFADFTLRAADELFNQLAKWRAMSAGEIKLPVVVRTAIGDKYGAQHSQDLSSLFTHMPGLKAVYPATPFDARGLMNSALSENDPVVFFESRRIYEKTELFKSEIPDNYYEIEIGEPDVKMEGRDVTLITVGAALYRAAEAAEELKKDGISAEIVDVRSLVPLNYEKIENSVKKTGRAVIIGDMAERSSFLKELSHEITKRCFENLQSPPVVLGAKDIIIPSYIYDGEVFPSVEAIIKAAKEAENRKLEAGS
jgi:Pyruvate/2-oxoglutarate dehydrogenase complex, dehydrogenase (E1) component, eukaryotic type, beta subunit